MLGVIKVVLGTTFFAHATLVTLLLKERASAAFIHTQLLRQLRQHAFELEKRVAERTTQLEAIRTRERHMIVDVAHGLKTPLALFGARLASSRSSLEPDDVETLNQSLKQLSDFVDDLLELARLEHSESLELAPCSLSELVHEVYEEVGIVASSRGISLRSNAAAGIRVTGDARELRVAIMNLIENSMKYMLEVRERTIEIRLMTQGDNALLSIRDTGVGIAPADLPHIFDRFYRANASVTGSGLGLAISKRIVELHGGALTAESAPGQGTTMTICLPTLATSETPA